MRQIDEEVRRMVEAQHERARRTIEERSALLREAARALLEREMLSGEELREIRPGSGVASPPA